MSSRPQSSVTLPSVLASGSGAGTLIGTTANAWSCTAAGANGGYYGPIQLPRDMDFSRPSHLYVLLSGNPGNTAEDPTVVLHFEANRHVSGSGTQNLSNWLLEIPLPDPFTENQVLRVLLDLDEDYFTWLGHVFELDDFLSLRIRRAGDQVADTYSVTLRLAKAAGFQYFTTCKQTLF